MSILEKPKNDINFDKKENGGNYKREEKSYKRTNAFDKLLHLQLLIQKHSGLKELCK